MRSRPGIQGNFVLHAATVPAFCFTILTKYRTVVTFKIYVSLYGAAHSYKEAHLGLKDKRNKRIELIKALEEKLESKLLVYFTADSPIVGAIISEDAILPMFDHLRAMGKQQRITLYLYSPGGQMETPWKLVTMLREYCEDLRIIVPYKAYSAA